MLTAAVRAVDDDFIRYFIEAKTNLGFVYKNKILFMVYSIKGGF